MQTDLEPSKELSCPTLKDPGAYEGTCAVHSRGPEDRPLDHPLAGRRGDARSHS